MKNKLILINYSFIICTRLIALVVVMIGLSLLFSKIHSQLNIDSVSHVNFQALHGANLNDVWGYVDEQGNEYAIVGTTLGTSVVDLSDPSNPTEIYWLPGEESIWRDPKVFGDYAYITTEAEEGLTIIDLSPLPQSPITNAVLFTGPIGNSWTAAHNCYADSSGYLYVFGANRGNGGIIIYDLNVDPLNPVEIGEFDTWYCHDGVVRNDTLYAAHIYDGIFTLIDVSNKSNPVLMGNQFSPGFFAHNIWPSQSGSVVYTTDEISAGKIGAFDITNPLNIFPTDEYQASPGTGVVPHNAFVKGDYLIASHYTEGVKILDVSYPGNIIEVGNYDTYPLQNPNYDGCWGVYPYLPSGLILASDMTEGLFILQPTYKKAAYLEGTVRDLMTNQPISNVDVTLTTNDQEELTNSIGQYATGIVNAGFYNVDFFKVGYFPKTESVLLFEDSVELLDVFLEPIPTFNFNVTVVDASTSDPISDAFIKLEHPYITSEGITNGIGEENFTLFYQEAYNLVVGKWGYETYCQGIIIDSTTGSIVIQLTPGFYDDFEFDFSWSVTGDAETGMWERGIPNATNGTVPGNDDDFDCGDFAYITGNSSNLDPDFDDVDNGFTQLMSPNFNFDGLTSPFINYSIAYYCFYGPQLVDDTLNIFLSNGTEQVLIDQYIPPVDQMSWVQKSIEVPTDITWNNTMKLILHISDLEPNVNVTEVMFDHFYLSNENTESIEEIDSKFSIFPNPTYDYVHLSSYDNQEVSIYDLMGNLVLRVNNCIEKIDVRSLNAGFYILYCQDQISKFRKL